MTSFGLLEKVQAITNQSHTTRINTEIDTLMTKTTTRKTVSNISSLSRGDIIIDNQGNTRQIMSIDIINSKVIMTGKNKSLSNYKKLYTWNDKAWNNAINSKGFQVA